MEAKNFKIGSVTNLTRQIYRLELEGSFTTSPVPGQFIHIKVDDRLFLRRPLSIAGYKNNILTLIFQVVGEGTKMLSNKKKGEVLNVIGPVGKGFPINKNWKNILAVGGGTGIAPLIFLIDYLSHSRTTFLYGARSRQYIAFTALPKGVNYIFATDDGSYGYKGLISKTTSDFLRKNEKPDVIYGGGPYELLKKIGELSEKHNIPAFVSMENRMACGMGLCYGCVTKIKSGSVWEYKRVCKDGPVFSTKEIIWE